MNLNSKQRANLKAMASVLDPVYIIGKGNVTDNIIKGIDEVIEKRELIKITVLKTVDKKAPQLINDLAFALDATPVCAIGNKIVLYRRSQTEGVEHIEF